MDAITQTSTISCYHADTVTSVNNGKNVVGHTSAISIRHIHGYHNPGICCTNIHHYIKLRTHPCTQWITSGFDLHDGNRLVVTIVVPRNTGFYLSVIVLKHKF